MRISPIALEAAAQAAFGLFPREDSRTWESLSAHERKRALAIIDRALRVYHDTPKRKS